ncbi:TRAP transporter small permease [Thorsellia kenyensis]|uniref:TRAP transporter small permease protein n=1 Tax=Thorsellia kenyensis TaxID=1549888 RepID=A0ABV6CC85_9GAMM
MKFLNDMLNKIAQIFCVLIGTTLVFCVVWQVFSRYVLNSPSTFTDELARFLFIWVALFGAAYTVGLKKHLAIDFLLVKYENTPKKLALLRILITLISLAFVGLIMIYGGINLVQKTFSTGQISPALGIQMGIVYIAIPISGVMMLWYMMVELVQSIDLFRTGNERKSSI